MPDYRAPNAADWVPRRSWDSVRRDLTRHRDAGEDCRGFRVRTSALAGDEQEASEHRETSVLFSAPRPDPSAQESADPRSQPHEAAHREDREGSDPPSEPRDAAGGREGGEGEEEPSGEAFREERDARAEPGEPAGAAPGDPGRESQPREAAGQEGRDERGNTGGSETEEHPDSANETGEPPRPTAAAQDDPGRGTRPPGDEPDATDPGRWDARYPPPAGSVASDRPTVPWRAVALFGLAAILAVYFVAKPDVDRAIPDDHAPPSSAPAPTTNQTPSTAGGDGEPSSTTNRIPGPTRADDAPARTTNQTPTGTRGDGAAPRTMNRTPSPTRADDALSPEAAEEVAESREVDRAAASEAGELTAGGEEVGPVPPPVRGAPSSPAPAPDPAQARLTVRLTRLAPAASDLPVVDGWTPAPPPARRELVEVLLDGVPLARRGGTSDLAWETRVEPGAHRLEFEGDGLLVPARQIEVEPDGLELNIDVVDLQVVCLDRCTAEIDGRPLGYAPVSVTVPAGAEYRFRVTRVDGRTQQALIEAEGPARFLFDGDSYRRDPW